MNVEHETRVFVDEEEIRQPRVPRFCSCPKLLRGFLTTNKGMTVNRQDLLALALAYIAGDVLGKKVLADALEEADDPRMEAVREEAIDWDELARQLAKSYSQANYWFRADQPRVRFQIDCVRYGSTSLDEIVAGVQQARRQFVRKIFPEIADEV